MKERPILFSGPMVRAILEGRKTQTRRVLNPQPKYVYGHWRLEGYEGRGDNRHSVLSCPFYPVEYAQPEARGWFAGSGCPYGQVGDRLWVGESWHINTTGQVCYRADGDHTAVRCKPSIFMPRNLSRITLEITDIRVQRLQEISEEDARAEGVGDPYDYQLPEYYEKKRLYDIGISVCAFAGLWDSINRKKYPWESNPWIWALTFKRLET